jgi:tRNA acetyltransferase TAN1
VTLDIPCVSFVRFPTGTNVDPVHAVRKLCLSAADKDASGPRSRYIKRLTPVSRIRKTMNDGLKTLCTQILPQEFQLDSEAAETSGNQPCKFAIRPTIRNNNQINRDEVIRIVADEITDLGGGRHKVDLKGYDKLVLVDVYRNVVGMSVVGAEYDQLKRFNLAEIHASRLDDDKKDNDNDA